MLIEIKDLKIGDEILIGGGDLKYYKLLRQPKMSLKKDWQDNPKWGTVKCSTRQDKIPYTYTTIQGVSKTYYNTKYIITPFDHNKEMYVDLNKKNIWLIKEGQI